MPKRAAALIASPMNGGKISRSRVDAATAWRRRTLRLADLCMKLDAEHVCSKAMRRWPVAAVLETTECWSSDMFAMVVREWKVKKVARLLEAKGRNFTVECCSEWEPEYLQVVLPHIELVTARHVLADLYFKSDDKHLSPFECRQIIEQYGPKAQRKLLCKFSERDVARVMRSSPADGSSDEEEEEEEEEDSMDEFIDDGEAEEGEAVGGDDEDDEDAVEADDDDDEDADNSEAVMLGNGVTPMEECEESSGDDDEDDSDDDGDDSEGDD